MVIERDQTYNVKHNRSKEDFFFKVEQTAVFLTKTQQRVRCLNNSIVG